MKIGNAEISAPFLLAPMAGVTDNPFRKLCFRHGAGFAYTEMVSAKALHYRDQKTKKLLLADPSDGPFGVQIFGSDPEIMAEIVKEAAANGASLVDINMGCPAPKIVKNGEGSALMKNPLLAARIIDRVANAASLPVTVKFRKGFLEGENTAAAFAKMAEQSGAAAVAVHGRTREQYYSGKADWSVIREVKEAVKIPVIGNGDIFEASDALRMMEETGCDAVMIARGAQGNPWIFDRCLALWKGEKEPTLPDFRERLLTAKDHVAMLVEEKGEHIGVSEGRKHIHWYLKGLRGAARVKTEVNHAPSFEKLEEILDSYLKALLTAL